MTERREIPYTQELARKSIHLSSLTIPLVYVHLERAEALSVLVPMTFVALVINILMYKHVPTRNLMMRVIGGMLRGHERDQQRFLLNGASWVLIAATLIIALTPKILAITSFTILIISDTVAALVGRRWGRRRFLDKSVLGSAMFFLSACLVVLTYATAFTLPWTYLVAGVVGAAVGTVIEAASVRLHVDDNLSIPFSIALSMWALAALGIQFPPFLEVLP
jgi:dolichol kinase